jgi:signal transduction histidine kinase/CheY-like chemotaxis protein
VGKSLFEFVVPEDESDTAIALNHAAQQALVRVEIRVRHKDGGCRWLSWASAPEAGLIYATGRHVTAEKEAAAELAAMQETLRQSQKMEAVGQLTGGIAHDFNNMLAVVIGSLDLLSRRLNEDDPRSRRYVEAAMDGANRAALLTKRLLAFSRQQPLEPKAIEPNKLVSGMSDLLRHSLGAEVRLETVLAGGLWRVHVDPNQLENVILNLAVNARDAMPDGGRLTIETQNVHLDARYASAHGSVTAGQYVLIAISDSGSGMDADTMSKAFDPFFTTKEIGKGTGLGLSQVYGFVRQSGGHVKIYSEPGNGTTVKIYLPKLVGPATEFADEALGRPLLLGERGEIVLVVDDEAAVRQVSVEVLRELGYTVLEADCGEKALLLLEAHPDVIMLFTDIVMPDMNGRKLADAARVMLPALKVLFTTGYTRNVEVHNGILDEYVHLIGKPFTVNELGAKMRRVLEDRPGDLEGT